ncbi:MAG: hypothetical protein KDC66_01860 [Phaeodactylibacter sp.]|nr:hypothetical protein [Phaeodactylibacter sp.]MCB9275274.1 hypothetical protein [Lewinellaceae bacterium]
MNTDSFARYLRNPSLLYQISYQELKSLALQFPYCQNLQWLLLQKSYMDGLPEWEQNLHRASAYSIDRRFLYAQMKQINATTPETDNFLLEEEYLELKSLAELETDAEALLREPHTDAEPPALEMSFDRLPNNLNAIPDTPESRELLSMFPETGPSDDEGNLEEPEAEAGLAPNEEDKESLYSLADEQPVAEEEHDEDNSAAEPSTDNQSISQAVQAKQGGLAFRADDNLIRNMAVACRILSGLSWPSPTPIAPPAAQEKQSRKSGRQLIKPELPALKNLPYNRPVHPVPLPQEPASAPKSALPRPRQSFTSWVEQFQAPHIQNRMGELMESKKRDEKKKKRKKSKNKNPEHHLPLNAIRSITESDEVVSETLAELLVSQGLADKALEMYQRLMLVFPEKSDYFASKIENLKSE